ENARRARDDLFSVQNSRKARIGGLGGLMDPAIMNKKKADEKKLKDAVAKIPASEEVGRQATCWKRIEDAVKRQQELARDYNLLEGGQGFNSHLFGIARTLLRAAEELPKPNGERLTGFRESDLASLKLQLFSDEPIYDDFEMLRLADSLTYLAEQLGYD